MVKRAWSNRRRKYMYKKRHPRGRKTFKKNAYNTVHKAFWKAVRPGPEVAVKEKQNRFPIMSALGKTVYKRFSNYKKQLFSNNKLYSKQLRERKSEL